MKIKVISILFLLISSVLTAQNTSSIDFVIRNLGINVDGHFQSFTINSEFNPNGELQTIEGKIKVSSIRTGIEKRDKDLLKDKYFNAKKHEFITLKSTSINKETNNKYEVKADLIIKGVTKMITIPIKVERQSGGYKITSSFEINRTDFKVGTSSFVMSKTVKLNVVHFQKF